MFKKKEVKRRKPREACVWKGKGLAMFSIGELVVHPMHGAGVINDIVLEKVVGVTKQYYVFQMPMSELLLKIPVDNSDVIGVRPVISREQAERLMAEIPELAIETNANWNKRYQENMLRLKSGDLHEVARVVKSLMHREAQRGLSTGERKMLHNAKQIMVSELVLAVECDYREAEARLNHAMMSAFAG